MELARKLFHFQFIRQLIQSIEVDSGSEPKGMRVDSEACARRSFIGLQSDAERLVDGILEAQFPGRHSLLEFEGHIRFQRECGPHKDIITCLSYDV